MLSAVKTDYRQMPASGPGLDGRTRIILAAERLFAEGGFNGVSLREIAKEAGQRNTYAVQYHFGSREGLIQAIFGFRMNLMDERRGRMLAVAESQDRLRDARTLLDITFLPQLDVKDEAGRHSYAGFLSQYLLRRRSTDFGDFGEEIPTNLSRLFSLLRARLDYLPGPVAQRRLVGCSLMFLHILVSHGDPGTGELSGESFSAALDDTLDQIVTCMTAPLRLPPSPC